MKPQAAVKQDDLTALPLVRQILGLSRLDPDLAVPCEYSPMGEKMPAVLRERMQAKACFNNAFHAAAHFPDARYVLGYWLHVVAPLEHAWVRVGDAYHDPTYEFVLSKMGHGPGEHYAVVEMTVGEVLRVMADLKIKYPPTMLEYVMWKRKPEGGGF